MRISATEEYGLRCILQLARLQIGEHISASKIAELEGISTQYASKMMHLFRKAELVVSERGLHGGFRLAINPKQIRLAHVFASLNPEPENADFCEKFSGERRSCIHIKDCSVRPMWNVLFDFFHTVLQELTLDDLINGERHTEILIQRRTSNLIEAGRNFQQSQEEVNTYGTKRAHTRN